MTAVRGYRKATAERHGHYSGPSGPSGFKPTKFDRAHFVGWDGEGAKLPDGSREYIYLANSEGGELVNVEGISTRQAFTFLTSEATRIGPGATHVGFGWSYDANMAMRDLPRLLLRRVWKGDRVRALRTFRFSYRPRKSLWVRNDLTGDGLTIWDVFGFYQQSFVEAVEKNLGRKDPRLPLIRQGKARRSEFTPEDLPLIRRYTPAEVSCLVDLCRKLHASFEAAGLRLRRWDGAGAAAAALLERERLKVHLASVPKEVHKAALYAFAGGRIETLRYGRHVGSIHHYDLRSAYPDAATKLPSLRAGRWKRTRQRVPDEPFSLVKVRWDFTRLGTRRTLMPFAFRASSGAIFFPRRGTNWVWRPELDAALGDRDLARGTRILDGWSFVPNGNARPFGWIPALYAERERMKRVGDPAEKAVKLSLNSCYGKVAQHLGGTIEHPPPFHQIEYAGMITSATRARLFDAARHAEPDVITLATDGIYATAPVPGLDVADRLGAWEYAVHAGMLIAQSGVYWLRNVRAKPDGCDTCGGPVRPAPFGCVACEDPMCGWTNLVRHYRGFDPGTLDPDRVLGAWRRRELSVTATSTRFITLGRATQSEEAFKNWRRWMKEDRVLEVHATGKRLDRSDPSRWSHAENPARHLLATDPADPFERVSSPYELGWASERGEESADAQEQVSL